jgi:hypothetical protein
MSKHFSTTNVSVQSEHCGIITRVIFWLKGVVGGKPPVCFLLEVANCRGAMDWDGSRLSSPAQSSEAHFGGSKHGDAVSDVPSPSLAVTEACIPNRHETRGPDISSPVDFGHAVGAAWNSLTAETVEPIWNTGFWKCIFGDDSLGDALSQQFKRPLPVGDVISEDAAESDKKQKTVSTSAFDGPLFRFALRALMTPLGKRSEMRCYRRP